MKRKEKKSRGRQGQVGVVSRSGERTLSSYTVGALPILNRIIARARITEFLQDYLREDERSTIAPSVGTVVLLKNFLTSRDPIYGVSDWARRHDPKQLGLSCEEVLSLNDDRVGRCLDRLFEANHRSIIFAVLTHVVREFDVKLDELHNDSTTVTFSGEYEDASERLQPFGKLTRVITWGHNKDHRPDLKQLLYTLTVTRDGAVPIHFNVGDGKLTDDQTHIETWNLVCEIAAGPDFLYVADSKLATEKNMAHIHGRGGRFVTVLPRTRAEDRAFRARLAEGAVTWAPVCSRKTSNGQHEDQVSSPVGSELTKEGYRLLWFHSTRKSQLDQAARSKRILRATRALQDLRAKLASPRTRYTDESKVRNAVERCLSESEASEWIKVEIESRPRERFKQSGPGRPGPDTQYRREVRERFDIRFEVDHAAVERSAQQDGVFPLVSNDSKLTEEEIYEAYKRQAAIEKRFAQLKTDYQLAPVFLKSPHRIEAMLTVYFLALLVQALLERELRRAMKKDEVDSLALYPEERDCSAPTARKTIDLFEGVQRHELAVRGVAEPVRFAPELSAVQKRVLRLLSVPASDYDIEARGKPGGNRQADPRKVGR
jgi:transposase